MKHITKLKDKTIKDFKHLFRDNMRKIFYDDYLNFSNSWHDEIIEYLNLCLDRNADLTYELSGIYTTTGTPLVLTFKPEHLEYENT